MYNFEGEERNFILKLEVRLKSPSRVVNCALNGIIEI